MQNKFNTVNTKCPIIVTRENQVHMKKLYLIRTYNFLVIIWIWFQHGSNRSLESFRQSICVLCPFLTNGKNKFEKIVCNLNPVRCDKFDTVVSCNELLNAPLINFNYFNWKTKPYLDLFVDLKKLETQFNNVSCSHLRKKKMSRKNSLNRK